MRLSLVCLVLAVTSTCQAQTAVLFGSDATNGQIGSIDRTTGAWTPIAGGPSTVGLAGLAYDPNLNVLYGCKPGSNSLFAVSQSTGIANPVATMGWSNVNGLAFNPTTNKIYGATLGGTFFSYNLGPGGRGGSAAGISGASSIQGLGFDPATSTLYGLDDFADTVVIISTVNGVAMQLSNPLPAGSWRGLDWDSQLGVLWATRISAGQPLQLNELYRVNPSTGAATLVGTLPTSVDGLAFKAPEYQVNQPGAALLINGIQGTPQTFAQVSLTAGQTALVQLASNNQGQPWEVAIGVAPLVPWSLGALSTIDGQLLNVNLADPYLTLQWGYFVQSPGFASYSTPVAFPFPGTLSIQMVVIAPGTPSGVAFSQPVRVVVQ